MADQLTTTMSTRIADLSPSLTTLSRRSFKAVVTLIWPYSSSNSALTVLLAEPDFRLRKAKGQVRVRFSGSSARSVFESGIGSGDEVTLGLEGAEWLKGDSIPHTPGSNVEWELKYTERLLLQILETGTKKIASLDIDHPEPQAQPDLVEIPLSAEIPHLPPISTALTPRPDLKRSENSEWASPAFVKRARVSYGSLFASGYDIFADDDKTVSRKGTRRSLFSRDSSSWRYSSCSASPEASASGNDIVKAKTLKNGIRGPIMTDEGCQTVGLDGDAATEILAHLPPEGASGSQSEVVKKRVITEEALSSTGGSSNLKAVTSPAISLLLAEVEGQEESYFQGDRAEEKDTSQLSPRLHLTIAENLPTDLSLLPSTPKLVSKGHVFHRNISFDGGESKSPRVQHDAPSQDVTPQHEIVEAEDLYGLSPTEHGHIETSVDDFKLSQTLLAQEYARPAIQSIYPDPEAGLDPEHYPRSPYYAEDQELSSVFDSTDKPQHRSDNDNDTKKFKYEDRLHLNTSAAPPLSAPFMQGYEDAQYRALQNSPVHDAKAVRPNIAGITMSRSQSAHSEVIDLTEDSDVGSSGSEDEMQSYPDSDDGQLREDDEENYDENDDDDEDGDNLPNSLCPRDFRLEDHLVHRELDEYEENISDQDKDSSEDNELGDNDCGSAAIKRLPGNEVEVIDLLSSDEEGVEENNGTQHLETTEDHGFRFPLQDTKEENVASDRDAYGEVEEHEGDQEEEVIEKIALEDGIGSIQAETLHQDYTSYKSKYYNGVGLKIENFDSLAPGEQRLAEAERSRPEADAQLQCAVEAGDLREDHPREEILFDGLGGYDGVNDHIYVETGLSTITKAQETTTGETQVIESAIGEIKYPILSTDDALQGRMTDPEAEALQDDRILTEDFAMEIHYAIDQKGSGDETLLASEVNFIQDELTLKNLQANPLSNGQLLTPDATQIATIAVSEPLSYPYWESEPVQDSQHPSSGPTIETQASPLHGLIKINNMSTPEPDEVVDEIAHEDKPLGYADLYKYTKKIAPVEPEEHELQNTETDIDPVSVGGPSEQRPTTPQNLNLRQIREPSSAEIGDSSTRSDDSPTLEYFDASATLAIAALESPSTREREQESLVLSDIALRVKLSRPLHTRLGHFTTLKLVRFNLEKKIDVLAIVASIPTEPSRAKNGPRHYHLRFKVTDASLIPTDVLAVHIFRPFKEALPSLDPGDGILLRSFIAKTELKADFGLRSDESSSWVVFKGDSEEEMRGPPVEFGEEEREHVIRLGGWYRGLDAKSKERLESTSMNKEKEKDRKGKGY